jgi:Phage endonuclease I
MTRKRKRDPTFKSGLERKVWEQLPKSATYETDKIKYIVEHTYNPDFTIAPNVYIEAKGRFLSSDRAKHLYIKEQHPEVKVHFLFGNADNTLTKSSKTTYRDWCKKYGYECADFYKDGIPKEWFKK